MMKKDVCRAEFAVAEFRALAKLCREWFHEEFELRDEGRWLPKLQAFREAVTTGICSGTREAVPHELVFFEYKVVYAAVKQLKPSRHPVPESRVVRRLQRERAQHDVSVGSEKLPVQRPFPVPKAMVTDAAKELMAGTKPSDIAHQITAARLGLGSPDTARKLAQKKPRRIMVPFEHALLASVFLDLCAQSQKQDTERIRYVVFDALLKSTYPGMGLYYLAWLVHDVPEDVCCDLPEESEVKKICDSVKAIDAGTAEPTLLSSIG